MPHTLHARSRLSSLVSIVHRTQRQDCCVTFSNLARLAVSKFGLATTFLSRSTSLSRSTYTYIHTFIHTNVYTYMHTYIHSYIHTCIHTYIRMIYTYIHTYYTHTHTLSCIISKCLLPVHYSVSLSVCLSLSLSRIYFSPRPRRSLVHVFSSVDAPAPSRSAPCVHARTHIY